MLLDIEGLDGAGKTTQARLLSAWLRAEGLKVETMHFPAYETPSGRRIAAYLSGEERLESREVMELFARNRWEKLPDLERARTENDAVILDRYAPSGWAYGLARGFPLEWLRSLDAGLPVPDLVVVLDVPVETAVGRLAGRGKADGYERNEGFLREVRKAYLRLAEEHGWPVIPDDRPREEISAELKRVVGQRLFPARGVQAAGSGLT